MSSAGVAMATRQMADLLSGGLSLTRSLDIVREQTRDKGLRVVFSAIRRDLEGGASLSTALAARGELFSPVYVGLVRSGESTGALDAAFEEIARHLDTEGELRQKMRSALVYPCLVLFLAAGICVFLATFVIPRFQLLFDDLGQRLPLPTRLLISVASLVHTDGALILAAGVAIIAATAAVAPQKFTTAFKRFTRSAASWPPLQRHLVPRFAERWSHLMAALTRGGFPVSDALRLTRRSLEPHPLAVLLSPLEASIGNGSSLSEALRALELFPLMVAELIAAGEEAGRLDDALARAARTLGRQGEASLKLAMTLLEPALIFFMAGIVGFVAIAMLLPIFEMSGAAR